MSAPFPTFAKPPVVETVLGVQFVPLVKLTSGHLGWFWRERLDSKDWPNTNDAAPLPPQSEVFGEALEWVQPGISLRQAPPAPRLQITNAAGERMIQLQSSRFHYNWQKQDAAYPRYDTVRQEFEKYCTRFSQFVKEVGVGELVPTQWEITYVDFFADPALAAEPREWQRLIPGLFGSQDTPENIRLETLAGEWQYEIVPRRGRLRIVASFGKIGSEPTEPGLITQMTARGAVDQPTVADVLAGLDVGHEAVVRTFLNLTSEAAHQVWGKKA